jgi:hypothetical protein
MPNVTDSLHALVQEVQRARNCVAIAQRLTESDQNHEQPFNPMVLGWVRDTVDILDAALDLAAREEQALADAAALTHTRHCAHCNRPFEVVGSRGDPRQYCGAPCRQAAYRARKSSTPGRSPSHPR